MELIGQPVEGLLDLRERRVFVNTQDVVRIGRTREKKAGNGGEVAVVGDFAEPDHYN